MLEGEGRPKGETHRRPGTELAIYSLDREESPQGSRDTLASSNTPKCVSYFRWRSRTLDMEQGLQRKWAWQVFEMSAASTGYIL